MNVHSDHICEYRTVHKIKIFSSGVKQLAINVGAKYRQSHSVYKMGRSSDLSCEQQIMIKALSTAGKTQGEISRQVGCSQCAVSKCLQGKPSGHEKSDHKRVVLPPSGTTGSWQNWCARTDFITAEKLSSSGMLMVCLHHDQHSIAE